MIGATFIITVTSVLAIIYGSLELYDSTFTALVSLAVAISILCSNVLLIYKLCRFFGKEEMTYEIKVASLCNVVFFIAFATRTVILTKIVMTGDQEHNKWVLVIGMPLSNLDIYLVSFQYLIYNIIPIGLLCYFHQRAFRQQPRTSSEMSEQ